MLLLGPISYQYSYSFRTKAQIECGKTCDISRCSWHTGRQQCTYRSACPVGRWHGQGRAGSHALMASAAGVSTVVAWRRRWARSCSRSSSRSWACACWAGGARVPASPPAGSMYILSITGRQTYMYILFMISLKSMCYVIARWVVLAACCMHSVWCPMAACTPFAGGARMPNQSVA